MKTLTTFALLLVAMTIKSQPLSNQANDSQFLIGGYDQKLDTTDLDNLRSLLIVSNCIKAEYLKFKKAAAASYGVEKEELNEEVANLYKKYESLQIEISEVTAKISYNTYDLNNTSIQALLSYDIKNESLRDKVEKANNLITDAKLARISAIEMREESYTQTNATAKLGNMSNAEEKELCALGKQNEAIAILEQAKHDSP